MDILDIFSWLPAKVMSLEQIENTVKDIENGISHEGYSVEHELPANADQNIVDSANELRQEGKRICCLIKETQIIAVIGYR